MANKDYIIRHCLIIVEPKEADQTELSTQNLHSNNLYHHLPIGAGESLFLGNLNKSSAVFRTALRISCILQQ